MKKVRTFVDENMKGPLQQTKEKTAMLKPKTAVGSAPAAAKAAAIPRARQRHVIMDKQVSLRLCILT